jgi:hypothetical protein
VFRKENMERAASIATVVAAVVAIVTFAVGVYQFTDTQQLARKNLELQAATLNQERESKAIELFLKFNELEKEVATKPMPKKGDASFWQYNMMLTLTESVFRFTEGDDGWQETVDWMLETQRPFLEGTPQGCRTFAASFLVLMKTIIPKMQCAT